MIDQFRRDEIRRITERNKHRFHGEAGFIGADLFLTCDDVLGLLDDLAQAEAERDFLIEHYCMEREHCVHSHVGGDCPRLALAECSDEDGDELCRRHFREWAKEQAAASKDSQLSAYKAPEAAVTFGGTVQPPPLAERGAAKEALCGLA